MELEGNDQIQEVTFLSPIQDPEIASKKQSIVDVLCKDANDVQIIVEMQVAPAQGFEKRAQYYASKAYCRQLNKGQGEDGVYYNLKEVIFIAIANCILFPEKKDYKSNHVILDKVTYEHDLKDFSFTFVELPKFKKDNIDSLQNMTEKWCYFFKHANATSEEELDRLIGSDLVIKRAYSELDQYNWSEDQLLAYEQEKKRIWDNKAVEDYIFDKGLAKGLEEGIEQGIEKGIEQGIEKGIEQGIEKGIEQGIEKGATKKLEEIAINMLRQNLDNSLISSVTSLSTDEVLKLKNKL